MHCLSSEELQEEASCLLASLFEVHDCPACALNTITMALVGLISYIGEQDPAQGIQHASTLEKNVEVLKKRLLNDSTQH